MATENPDFDRLFKKVVDAVNTPEEDYLWVNRPTPPIEEPRRESGESNVPVVAPTSSRSGLEVHFPAPSGMVSVIAGLRERLC